ncbi:hypothetical protein NL676_009053 [Syzygium grande]|nr:hypothetical protein NL676_009053 [Syzygium grande]
MNMRSVEVDVEHESAWVESGATIGELYYEISQKSKVLGFSAGTCPTVGVGGHVSGGGFGDFSKRFSQDESTRVLLNRTQPSKSFYKAKSDYVTTPIPEKALQGLWSRLIEYETFYMILSPYGGVMSQISDSETPFPHRSGNMYKIQYMLTWDSEEESSQHINWMRELYDYMAPYVSRFPRAAFLNYRDLDLGRNNNDNSTSYAEASVWGLKYFKSNFRRLAEVKTASDPTNFFQNEQSIPVLSPRSR